jgi:hypothetical protein
MPTPQTMKSSIRPCFASRQVKTVPCCGSGVKYVALELLALRNKLADKKDMLPSQALRMKWPAWVFEPPTKCPSPREIRRRLSWLGTQVQLVTEAVCGAAEKKTGDPLICSVE